MAFLVGVKETGEILGWDRRKVSTYHLRGVLPKPVVCLSSGPIWFRKQIEYYKAGEKAVISTFYINGDRVYECKQNHPLKVTSYSPEEISEHKGNYILFTNNDIEQLRNIIQENKQIAQFLSFESVSFLHDLGFLEKDVFQDYLQQYSKIGLSNKGGVKLDNE